MLRNVRTPVDFQQESRDRFPVSEDDGDFSRGENITKGFPPDVNSIPGEPTGRCYPILMVAIGSLDDLEARILEAAYHISVSCPGKNKKVIFEVAKWESGIWRNGTLVVFHMADLRGFEPAIKILVGKASRKFYLLNGMVGGTGLEPVTPCV